MSSAIAACTPSGGSTNGAAPRPGRNSATATTAMARSSLAVMFAAAVPSRRAGARQRCSGALALHADDGVGGEPAEELGDGLLHEGAVLRLQGHLDLVLGVRELRVGAQHQLGVFAQQVVEVVGERPLSDPDEDAGEE